MKKTFKERLEAGLKAMGYRLVPTAFRKYTVYHKDNQKGKIFVGKNGALRSGHSASSSFSLGDPGNQTAAYQRILNAGALGDIPFQYVVHWTEKDMITLQPRQVWQNFYTKPDAEQFAAAGAGRQLAEIKDCPWHPMWKPTPTGPATS